jgi:diguanylate cyclase (GGDEF)-like protein
LRLRGAGCASTAWSPRSSSTSAPRRSRLGDAQAGKKFIEDAIEQTLAGGSTADADEMLREYGMMLERHGDWRAAVDAYHRSDALRDQLMTTERQRTIINDLFGHPGGDAVLQEIARRLADSLRDVDTLVRWGGEEFLAVLPPMSRENLSLTVRRLLAEVQDSPVLWRGQVIPCTISVGYASFPLEGGGTEVPLNRAIAIVDKALYEAKKRGRNRACGVTSLQSGGASDLSSIDAAFDDALADTVVHIKELQAAP